ncbi:MAG: hypothetical protein K0A94_06090 [Desulfuromonadales bacterium]|nr:hypothetical protein [Desulfuromonadales bacterium]
MNLAAVADFFENFRTDRLIEQLNAWNVGDLHSNPWFIGTFVVMVLISYVIGWRAVSAIITGFGGFIITISLTLAKGTGTEGLEGGGLYIIVIGGAVAVMLFIYLLFIKTE